MSPTVLQRARVRNERTTNDSSNCWWASNVRMLNAKIVCTPYAKTTPKKNGHGQRNKFAHLEIGTEQLHSLFKLKCIPLPIISVFKSIKFTCKNTHFHGNSIVDEIDASNDLWWKNSGRSLDFRIKWAFFSLFSHNYYGRMPEQFYNVWMNWRSHGRLCIWNTHAQPKREREKNERHFCFCPSNTIISIVCRNVLLSFTHSNSEHIEKILNFFIYIITFALCHCRLKRKRDSYGGMECLTNDIIFYLAQMDWNI